MRLCVDRVLRPSLHEGHLLPARQSKVLLYHHPPRFAVVPICHSVIGACGSGRAGDWGINELAILLTH